MFETFILFKIKKKIIRIQFGIFFKKNVNWFLKIMLEK